ncbi:MAG TPA: hypothetical protein VK399_18970 [Longimicrobiaceae bacterium]|nr:hypothetical protein [Longimicrobiaceae bacterium]
MQRLEGRVKVLRAADYDAGTLLQAPPEALALIAGAAPPNAVTARFEVTYNGFSDEAKKAFQAAVDVWAVTLSTSVTIRVEATWTQLGPGILGQAGPTTVLRDFAGALRAGTWYPVALANKLAGKDQAPGQADISAEFNSGFDNWYFGTDGRTPVGKFDLMSVVLHEIGHGLGFVGSGDVSNGQGGWGWNGFPAIWDHFIQNGQGKKITDTASFPNPSPQLAAQLQGDDLFFNGAGARAANGGRNVPIFAPNPFDDGSSYSHQDEATFPAGNANSLMTPQLGRAEAIHSPGPIGMGILRDIGW